MKVYDDVELTFIENTHKYLVSFKVGDDWTTPKPTTGVSTYCSALSKDFLAPWAAKLAAEYMADNFSKIGKGQGGMPSRTYLLDEAKKQFKIAADSGARAGKLGHAFVEAKLKDKKIIMPTEEKDIKVIDSVAAAFEKFMADWQPELIEAEKVLYSKTHDYAGTCDLVCRVDGKLIILDWKTTNTSRYNPDGIYATYFAQEGGYSIAYEEMTGDEVEELWVVNLPKDGTEYKLRRLEDIKQTKTDCQAYFLALKSAYEQNQRFEWSLNR